MKMKSIRGAKTFKKSFHVFVRLSAIQKKRSFDFAIFLKEKRRKRTTKEKESVLF